MICIEHQDGVIMFAKIDERLKFGKSIEIDEIQMFFDKQVKTTIENHTLLGLLNFGNSLSSVIK